MVPLTPEQQTQVLEYYGLALHIARAISKDPEFEGVALLALVEAVPRFNPALGGPLEAWVRMRVRCAVRNATKRRVPLTCLEHPDLIAGVAPVDDTLPLPAYLQPLARLHFIDRVALRVCATRLGIPLRKAQGYVTAIRKILRLVKAPHND